MRKKKAVDLSPGDVVTGVAGRPQWAIGSFKVRAVTGDDAQVKIEWEGATPTVAPGSTEFQLEGE